MINLWRPTLKSKIILIVASLLAVLIGFQNCAQQNGGHSDNSQSVGESPFKSKKLILNEVDEPQSKVAAAATASTTSSSSDTLTLAVMVNERMRRAGQCGTNATFSAQRLPASPAQAEVDAAILPLWTYQVSLDKTYVLGALQSDVDADACVLGISNLNILKGILNGETTFQATTNLYFNTPSVSKTNLNSSLNTAAIADFITTQSSLLGANRIPVAVIGTGLNLSSTEFAHVSGNLAGSNYVERNSIPTDDHFLGSGIASLLAAKGTTQSTVKGLVPEMIDLLPIRVMGRGALSNDDFTNTALQQSIAANRRALEDLKTTLTAAAAATTILQSKAQPAIDLITQTQADATALSNAMDRRFSDTIRTQINTQITNFNTTLTAFNDSASALTDEQKTRVQQIVTYVQGLQTFDPNNPFSQSVGVFLQSANQALVTSRNLVLASGQPQTWIQTATARLNNMKTNLVSIESLAQTALLPVEQRTSYAAQIAGVETQLTNLYGLIANMGLDATATQSAQSAINNMLASYKAKILDQSVIRTNQLPSSVIADSVVRAVNNGAQVINLAVYGTTTGCDPILGEAIYQALKKNVVVVMPAGDDATEIIPANDTLAANQSTISPACWGQYFKGAITVGSYETTSKLTTGRASLAEFSNYGSPIKILSAGTSIPILDQKNQVGVWNGSLLATPHVTAAVATLIALHKTKGWNYYSPWLIEDLLMTGSDPADNSSRVPQAKILNFATLKTAIDTYAAQTDTQRRATSGAPLLMAEAPAGPVERDTLYISAKDSFISTRQRTQLQVQINKRVGPTEQIPLSEVIWTVSPSNSATIDTNGVLTPLTAAGRITLTASARSLAAAATIIVAPPPSVVTDVTLECINADRQWTPSTNTTTEFDSYDLYSIQCRLTQRDSRGILTDKSDMVSWSFGPSGQTAALAPSRASTTLIGIRPGRYDIVASLNGITRTFTFKIIQTVFSSIAFRENDVSIYNGLWGEGRYSIIATSTSGRIFDITGYTGLSFTYNKDSLDVKYQWIFTKNNSPLGLYTVGVTYTGPLSPTPLVASPPLRVTVTNPQACNPEMYARPDDGPGLTAYLVTNPCSVRPTLTAFEVRNQSGELVTMPHSPIPFSLDQFFLVDKSSSPEGNYSAKFTFINNSNDTRQTITSINFVVRRRVSLPADTLTDKSLPVAADPDSLKAPTALCLSSAKDLSPFATKSPPYVICNPQQFFNINGWPGPRTSFQLGNNLDLSAFPNQSVGYNNLISSFDGQGYAISNFTYIAPDEDYISLFIGSYIDINNLVILDPMVQGRDQVSAVANDANDIYSVQVMGTRGRRAIISGRNNTSTFGAPHSLTKSLIKSVEIRGTGTLIAGGTLCGNLTNNIFNDVSVRYVGLPNTYHNGGWGTQYAGIILNGGLLQNNIFSGVVDGQDSVDGIGSANKIMSNSFFGTASGRYNVSGLTKLCGILYRNIFTGSASGIRDVSGLCGNINSFAVVVSNIFNGKLQSAEAPFGLFTSRSTYMPYPSQAAQENYRFWGNMWDSSQNSGPDSYINDQAYYPTWTNGQPHDVAGVDGVDMGNGSKVIAVIGGITANSTVNTPSFTIPISGEGVAFYRYKAANGTDVGICRDQVGYSKEYPVGTPITFGRREVTDGDVVLCVLGIDSQGKSNSFANATALRWKKLTIASPNVTLSGLPGDAATLTTLNITVSGASAVTNYVYKLGPTVAGMCDTMTGASNEIPIATRITNDISGFSNGSVTLCVWGKNTGGFFQTTATIANWTKLGRPIIANVTGAPFGESSALQLDAAISGFGVTKYMYKVGAAATTPCTVPTGYNGAQTPVATRISKSLSTIPDGLVNLCVLGYDDIGNAQSPFNATMYSWTKSTTPPVAIISGAPTSPSNATLANLLVTGNRVTSYQYKWGAGTTFSCSGTGYQTVTPSLTQISLNLASTADGLITVCVRGADSAGNVQSDATATKVSWIKNTAAPVTLTGSGLPSTAVVSYMSSPLTIAVAKTSASVTSYVYKVSTVATELCDSMSGVSADQAFTVPISINTTSYPLGNLLTLCVWGKNSLVNAYQVTATKAQFVKASLSATSVVSQNSSGALNTTVSGVGIVSYKYKVGLASSTDCTQAAGYSAVIPVATRITDDFSDLLSSASMKLCLLGVDAAGNAQSLANATTISFTNQSAKSVAGAYAMGTAYAVETSTEAGSWSVNNIIDGKASSIYKSNVFTSASNSRGVSISAWTEGKALVSVSKIVLTAAMVGGVPQAFPASYAVYVSSSTGAAWNLLATYSAQPNANGQVIITLPTPVTTNGVTVTPMPTGLGKDSQGKYYFELAEVQLAK